MINWVYNNAKMHSLCILESVLKIINNSKNAFKFILNGVENGIVTKSKQKEIVFFKYYIKELPASLSQTKSNKDTIKNEFNLYLDTLGRHSFYPYGTKKNKKIQIDLDNTVYSVYLAQINFYAWLINRNLLNYTLEETINNEKITCTTKKQKN